MNLIDLETVKIPPKANPPAARPFPQKNGTILKFHELPVPEQASVIEDAGRVLSMYTFKEPLKYSPREMVAAILRGGPHEIESLARYYIMRIIIRYAQNVVLPGVLMRQVIVAPGARLASVGHWQGMLESRLEVYHPVLMECAVTNVSKMVELWYEF